jgi:putative transposase
MQLRRMPRSFTGVARLTPPPLSLVARTRLQALTVWQQTGNWRFAARSWGCPATLFRWRHRYVAADLSRLESQSHRPHHVWKAQTSAAAVRRLRDLDSSIRAEGEKLCMLLRRKGIMLSAKMIDRVLDRLRATGQLLDPSPRQVISAPRRQRARPYAVRNPRVVAAPGDLVQVDTLDVRLLPGVMFKQFMAREVMSHWDVVETYRRATSVTATHLLATLQRRMPAPIRHIQIDGGVSSPPPLNRSASRQGIHLFVLCRARRNSTELWNARTARTRKNFMSATPAS